MPLIRRFNSWRRHRRSSAPRRAWFVVAAAAVGSTMGSAALAPVASAGQLHVFQCQTPSGRNVPLENLDLDNGGLAFIGADNTCGTNDGVVGLWLGSLGRSAGQRVRATLNAPYYGSFQSVSVGRRARLAGGAGAGDTASPYWAQFKDQPILGDGSTLEFCAWYAGCADRNWNGTPGRPRTRSRRARTR